MTTISETLNRAADVLQVRGWTRATREIENYWFPKACETTPVCVQGAIRAGAGLYTDTDGPLGRHDDARDAKAWLVEYLTTTRPESINPLSGTVIPFGWNDEPGRTVEEVIEVLRAAAATAEVRESETVSTAAVAALACVLNVAMAVSS
jgi:hypothetical protein